MIVLIFCFVITIFVQPAFAYLDPGSGSLLISALVGLVASLMFFLKGLYYKGVGSLFGFLGLKAKSPQGNHQLVFYSEGRQYWSTFKPIIEELVCRGEPCVYLTSDEEDPGLKINSEIVSTKFIGKGGAAHDYLQFLEADVCAMTTPGLDVLQIKRSKGVKHYAHLIHSPVDAAMYKTYSFDYYDTVLVSGEHQIQSIKKLEEIRGTRPKRLVKAGCLYYDEMVRRLKNSNSTLKTQDRITVLVAPAWGGNGLLKKIGSRILIPLLERQYHVILRPHPQSFISEHEMIDGIREDLQHYRNLEWDSEKDGLESMAKADILLSDLSGIVFDFAFLFERPVITVKYDLNKLGLEAADLPWEPWELTVLDVLGRQINETELNDLPEILEQEMNKNDQKEQITELREQSITHFGTAAQHVVNELLRVGNEIKSEDDRLCRVHSGSVAP